MRTFVSATALLLAVALLAAAPAPAPVAAPPLRTVVFAGGCFWGMQAVFEPLRGVRKAVAGYSGGSSVTAHYDMVSTGTTGHAESVDITYDPEQISFKQLLDVYFLVAHDPTQLNRQGPDDGTQYRSEIYYTTPDQLDEAKAYIEHLQTAKIYRDPVVTKLEPLRAFYAAEGYHQDYVEHNPDSQYVVINDLPKLKYLRSHFAYLLKN